MLRSRRLRNWSAASAIAFAVTASACGPEFPASYFAAPEEVLLAAPEGIFAAEIARLAAPGAPLHRAVNVPGSKRGHTAEMDVAELRQALQERGVASPEAIVRDYAAGRDRLEQWLAATRREANQHAGRPPVPVITFGAGLPAEFSRYFAGALAWHQRQFEVAATAWREVLALPPAERKKRSVWAAFMLGRIAVERADEAAGTGDLAGARAMSDQAARWFGQTRAIVAAGATDPLGLAAASVGWEGRAALAAGNYARAIDRYLVHYATGDVTALASLRTAAGRAVQDATERPALCGDTAARRVVTAYLVAAARERFDGASPVAILAREWAAELDRAGVRAEPDADRLAWVAYEGGAFELARQWVALAPEHSPEAQWIRAKLALRAGDLAGGERLLRAAMSAPQIAAVHRTRIAAELGRVCLARDDLRGALLAWLAGGHWEDAAFVAERVMTLRELTETAAIVPSGYAETAQRYHGADSVDASTHVRHLLARRLARAGRAEDAENFFPAGLQTIFHDYVADLRVAFDPARAAADRAAAFWRAARCVRGHGMELLGTELDPDWAIWEGDFESLSVMRRRRETALAGGIFAPTALERKRLEEQRVPQMRFHYRYRAADLAWWGAALLPNDSEETARILAEAGGWLKGRDPAGAQRFYQALVIRCPNTDLGRAAAKVRWFPQSAAPGTPVER